MTDDIQRLLELHQANRLGVDELAIAVFRLGAKAEREEAQTWLECACDVPMCASQRFAKRPLPKAARPKGARP